MYRYKPLSLQLVNYNYNLWTRTTVYLPTLSVIRNIAENFRSDLPLGLLRVTPHLINHASNHVNTILTNCETVGGDSAYLGAYADRMKPVLINRAANGITDTSLLWLHVSWARVFFLLWAALKMIKNIILYIICIHS